MIYYKCDVCGREIDRTAPAPHIRGRIQRPGISGAIGNDLDLCSRCYQTLQRVDWWARILEIWRDENGKND